MRSLTRLLLALSLGPLTLSATALHAASKELKVVSVTPAGDNIEAGGTQIVVSFDQKVISVGAAPSAVPVTIKPNLPCQWRWLNGTQLACNLAAKDAFKPASAYTITIHAGFKGQNGAIIARTLTQKFSTVRVRAELGDHFGRWLSPTRPSYPGSFN